MMITIFTRELPGEDGAWWMAERTVRIRCCQCNRTTRDRPAVMRYRPELDDGYKSRTNSAWREAGWLVWWECDLCGYTDTSGTATEAQVRAISVVAGPWTRRDSEIYLTVLADDVGDEEAMEV